MRVLVYEFIQSAKTAALAAEVLEKSGAEVAGWVCRPRSEHLVRNAMPLAHIYPVAYPVPRACIGQQVLEFSAENEELIRLLLDREGRFESALHLAQVRAELGSYVDFVLDETEPQAVVFSDVPHNAFSFILFLAAQARGLRALFFKPGPAPYLFTYGEDVLSGVTATVEAIENNQTHEVDRRGKEYVERLTADYAHAKPSYMQGQERRSRWSSRLRRALSRPNVLNAGKAVRNAVTHVRRDRLREEYEARASREVPAAPYVAVFLHLQPERTTLPEGGRFGNQWKMVHALAAGVPSGWRVVVREHPSTFMTGARLMRGTWTYDGLLRIQSVQLASLETDPFLLVDGARLVATVSGSVGMEAITRGKPVLVFGSAPYLGCRGAVRVTKPAEVPAAIAEASLLDRLGPDDVTDYLRRFEQSPRAFIGTYDSGDRASYWKSGEAHCGVLDLMLRDLASMVGE